MANREKEDIGQNGFGSLKGDIKRAEIDVTTTAPGRAQGQLLIRSVKSAFALLLAKVTKEGASPQYFSND